VKSRSHNITLSPFRAEYTLFRGQNVYRQTSIGFRASAGEGDSAVRVGWPKPVLEAARGLVYLAHTDAITDVEDRRLIIGIESETDHLPVGEVRRLWAPEALREKDLEIASAEAWWKAKFLEACKRIAEGDINDWPTRSQPQ